MKKLLSLVLALAIMLCAVPLGTFTFTANAETEGTEGYYTYTVSNGKATITSVSTSISGEVVIPATLGGYPVTSIYNDAFEKCTRLTSIAIPDCVISIGSYTFRNCTSLESVTIGNGVTSIGYETFRGCDSLTSVTIPNSVTSIGTSAFESCDSLTSITIPDSVISIGSYAFSYCSSLEKIIIADGSKTVTSTMIVCKSQITAIEIPDSVTSIDEGAFVGCDSLTSIVIPDSVTSIGDYAFQSCDSLSSIIIPDSVTSIGSAVFYNTAYYDNTSNWENDVLYIGKHLIRAKDSLSGEYTIKSGTKTIASGAFEYCDLTSITIPDSVTSIGECAFEACTSLIGVYITDIVAWCNIDFKDAYSNPLYYAENLYLNGEFITELTIPSEVLELKKHVFVNCRNIVNFIIPEDNFSVDPYAFAGSLYLEEYEYEHVDGGTYFFNNLMDASGSGIFTIREGTKTIADNAFAYCSGITSIIIPDTVVAIYDSAFRNCTGLTDIKIPNSVTHLGSTIFEGCTNLKNVVIGDGIQKLSNDFFEDCNKIESLTLPFIGGSKTENNFLGYIFGGSTYSENIDYVPSSLEAVNISGVCSKIDSYAFYYCDHLLNVTIGNGVTSIDEYAFYYCKSLRSINIPDSIKTIGEYAFSSCDSIWKVSITDISAWCKIDFEAESSNPIFYAENLYLNGELVTDLEIPNDVTSIGDYAFSNCTSLESVIISNSVKGIGYLAFYYCTNLTSLTIPNNVTSIGFWAFTSCYSLSNVYYGGSYADRLKMSIDTSNDASNDTLTSVKWHYADSDPLVYDFDETNLTANVIGCEPNATLVTIPSQITENDITYDVISIGGSAFQCHANLTNIMISDSVTSIGDYALRECTALESVTIGNGITSIGNYAFYNCTSIESVTIPNSVTNIGYNAFYDCTSLKSVTIGNGATSIGDYAFGCCTSLTSISISGCVTSIGSYTFKSCTSLKNINLGNSTASIDNGIFENCPSLKNITVGEKNTAYTSIEGVLFSKDKSDIVLCPIGIDGTYTIPNGTKTISDNTFYNCNALTNVVIPDSVITIGENAFYRCSSLESVNLSNSTVSIDNEIFSSCPSLKNITVGEENTAYASIEGVLFSKDKSEIVLCPMGKDGAYTIPNGTKTISDNAFYNCSALTNVVIPDSVITIGTKAFYGCSNLCAVTLGRAVTNIGENAFNAYKGTVYYRATAQDGANINGVDQLSNANWYYKSCISNHLHTYIADCSENCDVCGDTRTTISEHKYDNSCDTICNLCSKERTITHSFSDATCTQPKTCTVCGETSGDALGHSFSNACDTNCNMCDYVRTTSHSYYAIYMANDESHWKQCAICGDPKDVSEHVYDNDCHTLCDVCGYERETTHSYKTEWDYNDTHHWHQCSVCADKIDEAEHVFDNSNDTECNICLATFEQPIILNSISVSKKPTKLEYLLGEELDLSGIELKLTYSDDSTEIITTGFTTTGFDSSTVGNKTITVEYNGLSASFTVNVIKHAIDENDPQIVIESKKVTKGNQFTVDVLIKNNPGFAYLEVTPVYSSELTLVSVQNGDLISDFTKGKQYVWVANEDVGEDGTLLTMTFNVDETIEAGNYQIGFNVRTCANYDEEPVEIFVVNSDIEVIDFIYGDATGDGVIDGFDVIRLKKYLANFDYDTQTSTIEIFKGADANGDEVIDGFDVIRLKKYLANFDYDIGESTVVLGPQ